MKWDRTNLIKYIDTKMLEKDNEFCLGELNNDYVVFSFIDYGDNIIDYFITLENKNNGDTIDCIEFHDKQSVINYLINLNFKKDSEL